MLSTAMGRLVGSRPPSAALHPRPDLGSAPVVINDYFWGTGVAAPAAPIDIPVCWLSSPVRLRLNPPRNRAEVTTAGGDAPTLPAYATNPGSVASYGERPFTATLTTTDPAASALLASWVTTYEDEPRMSAPRLAINLLPRTDDERLRILRAVEGQRIRLTGVPPEFPEGASSLVVTGRTQTIGVMERRIELTTAAVVGVSPGVPGPWFYTDQSTPDGSDQLAF